LNDAFKDMGDDPYTKMARSRYGKEYDYIYPAPRDKITVSTKLEGLFPIDLAAGASVFQNQAGPWQWWDPNSPNAKFEVQPGVTAHMASLQSNPDMSPEKGRTWVDTIQGYVCPRLALTMGYYTTAELSAQSISSLGGKVYPNPVSDVVNVEMPSNVVVNRYSVLDLQGREVAASNGLNGNTIRINVSDLAKGNYILKLDTDAGVRTQKIMVMH